MCGLQYDGEFRVVPQSDQPAGIDLGGLRLPRPLRRAAHDEGSAEIVLGIRPERFTILSKDDLETPGLELVVDAVEDTGAVVCLHTTAKVGQEATPIIVRTPGRQTCGKGEQLRVTVRPDDIHLFSAKTQLRLDTGERSA